MASAGDSLWCTQQMSVLLDENQYSSKIYPRFHAVDFLEFGDVLAQLVSAVQQQAVQDPNWVTAAQQVIGSTYATQYQCPITLQEMLLVLRNDIMWAFKSTQPGVQALYPIPPPTGAANYFQPYLAGTNCCANAPSGMKLPLPFVENIRSLVYRQISRGRDVLQWVPVLGQYNFDSLSTADYNYVVTIESAQDTIASFTAVPPVETKKINPKTGEVSWERAKLEVAIDLIDGASGTSFVFINDPGRIQALATLWNQWLSNQLNTYCDPLGSISTDLGTSITCSIAMTRYWAVEDTLLKERHMKKDPNAEETRDYRISSKKRLSNTPYAPRLAFGISSHGSFLSGPYEKMQSQWILPQFNLNGYAAFTKWQSLEGETTSTTTTTGVTGESFAMLHAAYASKMVHAISAPPSDWAAFFLQADEKGQGGVLSSLLASVAGSVFGGGAGAVAKSIADALPF